MHDSKASGVDRAFHVPRAVTIEGAVDFPGAVTVDGTIAGDISCTMLTVTERGIVDGSVRAATVIVMGEVSGAIFANDLTLKTACSVTADISHRKLLLEDGSYFEGKSRRHPNPLQLP